MDANAQVDEPTLDIPASLSSADRHVEPTAQGCEQIGPRPEQAEQRHESNLAANFGHGLDRGVQQRFRLRRQFTDAFESTSRQRVGVHEEQHPNR